MSNIDCITKPRKIISVGNKVVGYIEGNTFFKPVLGSRHKLRNPPAWAIDAEVFDTQVKPNTVEMVVIDRETGTEYHISTELFDRLKGKLNRGFGRQYFLTLKHWETEDIDNKQLRLWEGNVG